MFASLSDKRADSLCTVIARVATYPLEIVRLQLQAGRGTDAFGMALEILREEGPLGLWKGCGASLARCVLGPLLARLLQPRLRDALLLARVPERVARFAGRVVAEASSLLVTLPLDTLRLRQALAPLTGPRPSLASIAREEGAGALMAGAGCALAQLLVSRGVEAVVCRAPGLRDLEPFWAELACDLVAQSLVYPLGTLQRRLSLPGAAHADPLAIARREGWALARGVLPNALWLALQQFARGLLFLHFYRPVARRSSGALGMSPFRRCLASPPSG